MAQEREARPVLGRTVAVHYDPGEDRVRVILNGADAENRIDFWLTRRLLLNLLGHITKTVAESSTWTAGAAPEMRRSLLQAERDFALTQTARRVSRAPKAADAPASTTGPAHLVQRIGFRGDGEQFAVEFMAEPARAVLPLARAELYRVATMLSRAAAQGKWVPTPPRGGGDERRRRAN